MKAFLVDDEFLQRKLVKKSVDRQSIGIELLWRSRGWRRSTGKRYLC